MPRRLPRTPLAIAPFVPIADDTSLVDRIRAGDAIAFRLLFDRYYDALCDFAERRVGATDGEELVEQLFVRLWSNRQTWVVRDVKDYLFGAVRNEVKKYERHRRVVARVAAGSDGDDGRPGLGRAPISPDEHVYAADLRAALWRAIGSLPARRRDVLTLRFRDARTYAEIAAQLGLSLKTVETHISRALKTLRHLLREFS